MGVQWLSGRVLDSRPRGRGFEPHRRHCVVSLSKNINPSLVLVQPRKTHPFKTERLLMGCKESNQTNTLETKPVLDCKVFCTLASLNVTLTLYMFLGNKTSLRLLSVLYTVKLQWLEL